MPYFHDRVLRLSRNKLYFGGSCIVVAIVSFSFVCSCTAELRETQALQLAAAAIIVAGSLGITLHNRNASISGRIRELTAELGDIYRNGFSSQRVDRIVSIRKQLRIFKDRFVLNSLALIDVFLSLALTGCLALLCVPASSTAKISAPSLYILSTLGAGIGLLILFMLLDLTFGFSTMQLECNSGYRLARVIRKRKQQVDPRAFDALLHFNLLYHKIWFEERLELESISDDSEFAQQRSRFWERFFGFHEEQFHFHDNGLLPELMYSQWESSLQKKAMSCDEDGNYTERLVGRLSIVEGWLEVRKSMVKDEFVDRMNGILEIKTQPPTVCE